jgi:hypothetical protein
MFDTRAMAARLPRPATVGVFDPDAPASADLPEGLPVDLPEGRVWGAGGRVAPRLVPVPSAPARRPRRPAPAIDASALRSVAARSGSPVAARERTLPVPEVLADLLPEGLRRGSTVGVVGAGATSLALTTVAAASAAGSWVVAVGADDLGLASAVELGVAAERLAVVAAPPVADWGTVVAALVGAVDIVLVAPRERVRGADLRRLEARSRERGSVLVHVGDPTRWPASHDLVLTVTGARWSGVGAGHGRLTARRVVVEVTGRREARARRAELLLPGASGRPEPVPVVAGGSQPGAWAGADLEAGLADRALGAVPSPAALRGVG